MRRVVRAGRFDWSDYDPLDWVSRLRLSLAISDEADAVAIRTWRAIQDYNIGFAGMGGEIEFEHRKKAIATALEAMQHILKLEMPWKFVETEEKPDTAAIRKMRDVWEETWGKLDDPETQRKIAATAEWLKRHTAQKR